MSFFEVVNSDETDDYDFRPPSGKCLRVQFGVLGISPDLEISEGYDGQASHDLREELSVEDLESIADTMISRWTEWKELLRQPFENDRLKLYDSLYDCYRSGQMSEAQWQEHLEDNHFNKWYKSLTINCP